MDLRSYIQSLNPVVFRDFWLGDTEDYSVNSATGLPYGRTLGVDGTPAFTKSSKGHSIKYKPTGDGIYIPDGGSAPETQVTEATLMLGLSMPMRLSDNGQRFLRKRSIGNNFDWAQTPGTAQIALMDSTGFRSLNTTGFIGAKFHAVTFSDGDFPEFFADGVSLGLGSSQCAIVASDDDMYIGQSGALNRTMESPINWAAIVPSVLSDAQLAEINRLFVDRTPIRPNRQLSRRSYFLLGDEKLAVAGRVEGNKVKDEAQNLTLDRSGLQVVHGPSTDTPVGRFAKAHGGRVGSAFLEVNDSSLDDLVPITWSFWVRRQGAQEGTAGRIWGKSSLEIFYFDGNSKLRVVDDWTSGAVWETAADLFTEGAWAHVVIRYERIAGSVPTISINGGTETALDVVSASSGTMTSDAGALTLLDRSAKGREFSGDIADLRVFNRLITDAEVEKLYHLGALRTRKFMLSGDPVTLVTRSSLDIIRPFQVTSGTWDYNYSSDHQRVLSCASAGDASVESKQAFGAWAFDFYEDGAIDNIRVHFVSSAREGTTAPQDGYRFAVNSNDRLNISRIDNGSGTNLANTADNYISEGTWYEAFITRSNAGEFKVWIRGGVYSAWVLALSVVDTTHTDSNFIVLELDDGCQVRNLQAFPYGGGLEPNDVPWLKDA